MIPSSSTAPTSGSQPLVVEGASSHVHSALATMSPSDGEAPRQTIKSVTSVTPASASTHSSLSDLSTTTATGHPPSSTAPLTSPSEYSSATIGALSPTAAAATPSAATATSERVPPPRRYIPNLFMLPHSGHLRQNQPSAPTWPRKQWPVPEALLPGSTVKRYPTPPPQQFIPLQVAIAMGTFGDDPYGRPPLTVGLSERQRQAQIKREAKRKQAKEEKQKKREERRKKIEEERKKRADERRKGKQDGRQNHSHGEEGMDGHCNDCDCFDSFEDDIDDQLDDESEDEMEEECV